MANHRLYPFWGNLTTALRTGEQQNESKGGGHGLFEALYADPARLKGFLRAMSGISRGANIALERSAARTGRIFRAPKARHVSAQANGLGLG